MTEIFAPTGTLDVGTTIGIPIVSGFVRLDALGIPYGTAEVDIPLTEETALDAFDPRDDVRILIHADDGRGGTRDFDLGLRSREVDYRGRTVHLRCTTDEAIAQDYAPLFRWMGYPPPALHENNLAAMIDGLLGSAIGADLEPGGPTADVTRAWETVNEVTNPVADTITGYSVGSSGTNLGINTTSPWVGTGYVRWASTSTAVSVLVVELSSNSVIPGRAYVGSAYVRASVANTRMRIRFQWFNRAGASLGLATGDYVIPPTSSDNPSWIRCLYEAVAPVGAATVAMHVLGENGPTGTVYAVDGVMFNEAPEAPWFSGATTANTYYSYAWTGTANASASVRTPVVERPPETLQWRDGVSLWDFLEPLTTSVGLRLFADETRLWRLVEPSAYAVPGVVSITPETATSGSDTITRDEPEIFATGIVLVYEWTDDDGIVRRRTDYAGTPEKVHRIEIDTPFPGPGAAAQMLARRSGSGRVQEVEALPDLTATPGMEASLSLPYAPTTAGRVVAVEWSFGVPTMSVQTTGLIDVPEGSWLAWNAEDEWVDVADSVTWTSLPA